MASKLEHKRLLISTTSILPTNPHASSLSKHMSSLKLVSHKLVKSYTRACLLAMDLQFLTISNPKLKITTKGKLVNILLHLGQGRSTSFSNCSFFAMEFGKSQTLKLLKSVLDSSMGEGGGISTYQRPLIINTRLWC